MILLAAAVPSAPQTGQFTVFGMRPFSGSMSKVYFCPQLHSILMAIILRPQTKRSMPELFHHVSKQLRDELQLPLCAGRSSGPVTVKVWLHQKWQVELVSSSGC